jgi:hypothetical protein
MLVDTNPQMFVVLVLIAACLGGPAIYLILYIIASTICWVSSTNQPSPNELQPDTRVGCPDGLCYLQLFKKRYHSRIIENIGHFPSIMALSAVAKSYRRNAKGTLTLIGDGLAHYEPVVSGGLAWDIVGDVMTRFDLIGGRQLSRLSFKPPEGYSYIELFVSTKRDEILKVVGPYPSLQTVINVDSTYRSNVKGFLWKRDGGFVQMVGGFIEVYAWDEVIELDSRRPGSRFSG